MTLLHDDMNAPVELSGPPARVVSLVPSLTESVAASAPEALIGATQWCTHPPHLDVPRVRGTKNPDRRAIADLRPDLVLANKEENRELDVRRLREAGLPVWVTVIETVPDALASLERLFTLALQRPVPDWLATAKALWDGGLPDPVADVVVPIWREPWMVVGRSTYTGDLLRRAGLRNVFETHSDRYPAVDLADLDREGVDAVLLPDEPYVFTADDGPEAFTQAPTRLVSGRLLTWYGPAMVEAHVLLSGLARELSRD